MPNYSGFIWSFSEQLLVPAVAGLRINNVQLYWGPILRKYWGNIRTVLDQCRKTLEGTFWPFSEQLPAVGSLIICKVGLYWPNIGTISDNIGEILEH